MTVSQYSKGPFTVIGKEGSTNDGDGFIARLWEDANGHFDQVAHLAKRDEQGGLMGTWGAMSDFSRSFRPWEENFTQGLYLAGVECLDGAEAPKGWSKWEIPGYEYLCAENEGGAVFAGMLEYLQKSGFSLAGAVQDFFCPQTGKGYMLFPIRAL